MKLLFALIPFAFLVSLSANALDLGKLLGKSETYSTKLPELQKSVQVVIKDNRCSFATVAWPRPNAPKVMADIVMKDIALFYCVGDLVFAEGTLKEKKGCGAFLLNGNTLQTQSLGGSDYQMSSKNCASGGFEELVGLTAYRYKVGEHLINVDVDAFTGESIVLYSDNPKYLTWYKTAKLKKETETKKDLTDYKTKHGSFPKFSAGYQDKKDIAVTEIKSGDPLIKGEGK
jgi:hypothetical protein